MHNYGNDTCCSTYEKQAPEAFYCKSARNSVSFWVKTALILIQIPILQVFGFVIPNRYRNGLGNIRN